MTNSLHSCGNIILLISGGGMLRFILQNSGIGELFGNFVGGLPLPMVLVAFLVAAVVRVSVGSATVSMTMAAPYHMLKFMPTGGINTENLKEYLACDKILCCGGSWMVKGDMIKAGEFEKIKKLTQEAKELAE